MAALLKKRALAEFSHVIQEEAKPKPKKLRLTHRSKASELQLDLTSCQTSFQALKILLKLEEELPLPLEQVQTAITSLLEFYMKQKDSAVRAKVANILGELSKTPNFDSLPTVEELKAMIQTEKSQKVLSQLIEALLKICITQGHNETLHGKLLGLTLQLLDEGSHLVKAKCLEFIASVGSPELVVNPQEKDDSLQSIVGSYTCDGDSRVRCAAFQAMLTWHRRGKSLDGSSYSLAVDALTDDYEGVRVMAVKLIWVHCQLSPETLVQNSDKGEIRQVDDGFAKICNMVNDLSMKVRAEALQLLGSLHDVSSKFLMQTLDKKLMSNMRRKTTAHERQKDHFKSGEWSTGSKWAEDAPKEEVDAEEVSLISSGACGAFVHGLEDEFLEVRNAAIDAVCELALVSQEFAEQCQDFLFDMFNDEIDSVRLNAINSLRKISHCVIVREDQLEIILGVLKDYSSVIRGALQELCGSMRVSTKSCLNALVMGILDNIKRYSEDSTNIWKCMKNLGTQHPALVNALVPELLSTHPYFEAIEPEVDDPAYMSVLVLVFNAALKSPTMPSLFPVHTTRHYLYLRRTMPDLVPELEFMGVSQTDVKSADTVAKTTSSPQHFFSQILQRLESLNSMDLDSASSLIHISLRDLDRVGQLDAQLSASSSCLRMYLKCQLCVAKAMNQYKQNGTSLVATQDSNYTANLISKVVTLCEVIEQQYLGLGVGEIAQLQQLQLRAHTLQLMTNLQQNLTASKSSCLIYLQILNNLQRLLSSLNIKPDDFTDTLFQNMSRFETCDPAIFCEILPTALTGHTLSCLKLSNQVLKSSARILHPIPNSEQVHKFMAGLTGEISIEADIENTENLQSVALQVRYPDQRTQLSLPRTCDFHRLSRLRHKLKTSVLLSHIEWSESCPVEISLVLAFTPAKQVTPLSCQTQTNTGSSGASKQHVIELCPPVKVLVLPGPSKKL